MNIDMIRAAAERGKHQIRRTPLLFSEPLNDVTGRQIFVKAEALQYTGSFKYRGAFSALSLFNPAQKEAGVLAFSSGNHAQGIALAARQHGIKAVIIMPADAPEVKIQNTKALGAEVITYDRDREDRDALGADLAGSRGLKLVKPFDEPLVIAGQGTTGLEIAHQAKSHGVSEADVLVCCGGGGLSSGIALALAHEAPDMRVMPCEPQGFEDVMRSLESGKRERNTQTSGSLCDAIVTPSPGEITFPILKKHCDRGFAVSDEEALTAMAYAFKYLKLVLEPGGAVALATALFRKNELSSNPSIVVASGGNVDGEVFAKALAKLDTV